MMCYIPRASEGGGSGRCSHANRPVTSLLAALATGIILAMNGWLLYAIATGKS